MISLGGHT